MILLIDGYNLLKYLHGPQVNDQQRYTCTQQLNAYARRQQVKPQIIYDGGTARHPVRERHDLVTVIYAGWKMTADSYMQEYITNKQHNNEELLVVSSDRQIALHADKHQIPSINVALFWHLVQAKITQAPVQPTRRTRTIKLSPEHNPDLDTLMYAALPTAKDTVEELSSRIKNAHTSSKIDAKLLTIIKKLL